MYWDKISSRSNYDKKMFEEDFSKGILKNTKEIKLPKKDDEVIFNFLKNQLIDSINYTTKI